MSDWKKVKKKKKGGRGPRNRGRGGRGRGRGNRGGRGSRSKNPFDLGGGSATTPKRNKKGSDGFTKVVKPRNRQNIKSVEWIDDFKFLDFLPGLKKKVKEKRKILHMIYPIVLEHEHQYEPIRVVMKPNLPPEYYQKDTLETIFGHKIASIHGKNVEFNLEDTPHDGKLIFQKSFKGNEICRKNYRYKENRDFRNLIVHCYDCYVDQAFYEARKSLGLLADLHISRTAFFNDMIYERNVDFFEHRGYTRSKLQGLFDVFKKLNLRVLRENTKKFGLNHLTTCDVSLILYSNMIHLGGLLMSTFKDLFHEMDSTLGEFVKDNNTLGDAIMKRILDSPGSSDWIGFLGRKDPKFFIATNTEERKYRKFIRTKEIIRSLLVEQRINNSIFTKEESENLSPLQNLNKKLNLLLKKEKYSMTREEIEGVESVLKKEYRIRPSFIEKFKMYSRSLETDYKPLEEGEKFCNITETRLLQLLIKVKKRILSYFVNRSPEFQEKVNLLDVEPVEDKIVIKALEILKENRLDELRPTLFDFFIFISKTLRYHISKIREDEEEFGYSSSSNVLGYKIHTMKKIHGYFPNLKDLLFELNKYFFAMVRRIRIDFPYNFRQIFKNLDDKDAVFQEEYLPPDVDNINWKFKK